MVLIAVDRVKQGCLATNAVCVDFRMSVHVNACFEKYAGAFHGIVLGTNVEWRNAVQGCEGAFQVEYPIDTLRRSGEKCAQTLVLIE